MFSLHQMFGTSTKTDSTGCSVVRLFLAWGWPFGSAASSVEVERHFQKYHCMKVYSIAYTHLKICKQGCTKQVQHKTRHLPSQDGVVPFVVWDAQQSFKIKCLKKKLSIDIIDILSSQITEAPFTVNHGDMRCPMNTTLTWWSKESEVYCMEWADVAWESVWGECLCVDRYLSLGPGRQHTNAMKHAESWG